jgi:CRISPR system Cascade subunit CasA
MDPKTVRVDFFRRRHRETKVLRLWRQVLAGLMLGALAACATYRAAPLDPRHTARQFAAQRLDDSQLRDQLAHLLPHMGTSWPPQTWDRGALLAVALLRNPGLAVARAQIDAAVAREITAAQVTNPDLTLLSEYAAHREAHPWLYGLSLDWLLRSPGRRSLEREIARSDTINMRSQLMDQTWRVRHSLSAALSDWEGARRRLRLLDRLVIEEERLLGLEKDRVRAGEDSPGETLTLEQARIEIEQQQAEVRATANAAQAATAKALGLPPQALDGIAFAWPDWGVPPPVNEEEQREAREQALLSRSDLAMAVGDYASAESHLKLAVLRQYPQLTVNPGYYWDHGIAKFPFNVGLTLPVNGNKGEIAEALAAREVAGKRLLALQADIYGEITAAERAESLARASAKTAEQRLATTRRQLQQSELGLRLGESNGLERVGSEILTIRSELEVLEMQARLQAARDDLEDVLHAPLSGPEIALAQSSHGIVPGEGS